MLKVEIEKGGLIFLISFEDTGGLKCDAFRSYV